MIKLAVLLSGRWRQLDETLPKLKDLLHDERIHFRIFASLQRSNPSLGKISSPSQLGLNYYTSLSPTEYKSYKYDQISESIAREHLTPDSFEIAEISLEKAILNQNFLSNGPIGKRQFNGLVMYKGMQQVFQLLLKNDPLYKENFTHFLRIRSDFEIYKNELQHVFLDNDFFFIGETLKFGEHRVNDQCFGGKIDYCEYFMNGYDLVKNEIQTMEWQSNRDSNSIAENVIHSLIREIDANLIVGYYPSSGKLLRPKVKRKWFPRSASFLHLVMAHNLLVFKTKTIRVLQSKNVKGFCA